MKGAGTEIEVTKIIRFLPAYMGEEEPRTNRTHSLHHGMPMCYSAGHCHASAAREWLHGQCPAQPKHLKQQVVVKPREQPPQPKQRSVAPYPETQTDIRVCHSAEIVIA